MLSLRLGRLYLLLQLNTHRTGFHPAPDGSPYPNALNAPAWTICARNPLQRHSLNRRVSREELREYGEDHCAGPMHLAYNLYGKVIKPLSFTFVNPPLKTLDPQEVRTNFNQRKSISLWGRAARVELTLDDILVKMCFLRGIHIKSLFDLWFETSCDLR